MDAVLLDTDVFSFLMKEGDTRAALYKSHVLGKTIALSFVTVGELYVWTIRRRWNARRIAAFEQSLRAAVVVAYDLDLCKTYAKLRAALLDKGQPVAANDLWIAASAVRHSIPLITHNSKHFASIRGLKVITES
ncbi:MAG: type II toxin-antitoxin system VapC family toxin [Candidatus Acidiferrum sp.]